MEREQIIADYKKARHITDDYILDEDEMYFVEHIYNLQNQISENLLEQAREEAIDLFIKEINLLINFIK